MKEMTVQERQEFFADLASQEEVALYLDLTMSGGQGQWFPVAAVASGGYYRVNVPCNAGTYEQAKQKVAHLNKRLFGLDEEEADQIVLASFRNQQ